MRSAVPGKQPIFLHQAGEHRDPFFNIDMRSDLETAECRLALSRDNKP
jgi:hypothetical protein